MFRDARDVAQAALDLLEMGRSLDPQKRAQLELSAAILATSVADWHFRPTLVGAKERSEFRSRYPAWDCLRHVANGTKHAHPRWADIEHSLSCQAEWEDVDFWHSLQQTPILFVEVEGEPRAVHALVWDFCTSF